MSQTPRLEEVIESAIAERIDKFYTAIPARVIFYSPKNNTVSLDMEMAPAIQDSKGQNFYQYGKANGVPVLFPGSGNHRITTPINEGDIVLYIVSTLPLYQYMSSGVQTGVVAPSEGRNNLGTGFAIPGLFTYRHGVDEAPTDAIVMHGRTKIGGASGTEVTFKADTFLTRFNAFLTTLESSINGIAPGVGTTIKNAWVATGIKTVFTEVK